MSTQDHKSSLEQKITILRSNANVKMQQSMTLSERMKNAKTNASSDYYKKKLVANNLSLSHLLMEIEAVEQALTLTEDL